MRRRRRRGGAREHPSYSSSAGGGASRRGARAADGIMPTSRPCFPPRSVAGRARSAACRVV